MDLIKTKASAVFSYYLEPNQSLMDFLEEKQAQYSEKNQTETRKQTVQCGVINIGWFLFENMHFCHDE